MARIGSTVRLTFTFRAFPVPPATVGELADSSTPVMIQPMKGKKAIGSPINLMEAGGSHPSLGVYQYDYVIPDVDAPVITIEATGTIEGTPSVAREGIPISWGA